MFWVITGLEKELSASIERLSAHGFLMVFRPMPRDPDSCTDVNSQPPRRSWKLSHGAMVAAVICTSLGSDFLSSKNSS